MNVPWISGIGYDAIVVDYDICIYYKVDELGVNGNGNVKWPLSELFQYNKKKRKELTIQF
jgi:hypothetical protein